MQWYGGLRKRRFLKRKKDSRRQNHSREAKMLLGEKKRRTLLSDLFFFFATPIVFPVSTIIKTNLSFARWALFAGMVWPLRWSVVLMFVFGCISPQVSGQSITALTVDHGLSQGFISAITCDEEGYIWLGTLNGLNRYDGAQFRVWNEVRSGKGLLSDYVTCLKAGNRSLLWIGTSKGLQVMDRRTGEISGEIVLPDKHENVVQNIEQDEKGRIWLASDRDVWLLEPPEEIVPVSEMPRRLRALKIEVLREVDMINSLLTQPGLFFTGTDKGAFQYDIAKKQWQQVQGLPAGQVQALCQLEQEGVLMARYDHGFQVVSGGQSRFVPLEFPVWNCEYSILSRHNQIYLLSRHAVHQWKNNTLVPVVAHLEEEIVSGAIDIHGQIWLGTNAKGLRIVKPASNIFSTYCNGLSIGGAVMDKWERFWLPRFGSPGMPKYYQIDFATGGFGKMFGRHPIRNLYNTRSGEYWAFIGYDILIKMDANGREIPGTRFVFTSDFYKKTQYTIIGETSGGDLVISDPLGNFVLFDPQKATVKTFKAEGLNRQPAYYSEIRCVAEYPRGVLWLASAFGVVRLQISSGQISLFDADGPPGRVLSSEKINQLIIDPEDSLSLWVATVRGLNHLDTRTGRIKSYTRADGLNDDFIYTILQGPPHELWLGTNRGLLCFNTQSKQVMQYTVADGLPASEFNTGMAWRTRDSSLIFGTVSGLVHFNPYKIGRREKMPEVRITQLKINGRPYSEIDSTGYRPLIDHADRVVLQADENNIEFQFTVMDFLNLEKYNCRYMLSGLDRGWRYGWSNTLITYTNLPPGEYDLLIAVGDATGVWSEGQSLHISIRAPWWNTWWAYLIGIKLAILLAWSVYLTRTRINRMERQLELDRLETKYREQLEANRNQMFINISHEIRTPLTIILGLADEMRRAGVTPDLEKKILLMAQSGQQLLQVVQQILDLSRMENNALRLQPKYGDLAAFIRQTVAPFSAAMHGKGIRLEEQYPEQPLMGYFDPQYTQPIIANLLSNALKFTPKGGRIAVSVALAADNELRIRVEDSGIGIDPAHQSRIFERYYQVEQEGARGQGTGIGLTYVAELLKLMGGTIEVQSSPGAGACFEVRLPLTAPLQAQEVWVTPIENIPQAVAQKEQAGKHAITVLVVEDNYEMMVFLQGILSPRYQVLSASGGEDGWRLALDRVPDLVVTDVMMPPGIDGFELCRRIKNNPVTSHIPVIMLTALATESGKIQGLQQGANVYLPKPFNQEILLLHMANLIEMRTRFQQQIQPALFFDQPAPAAAREEELFIQKVRHIIQAGYADSQFGVDALATALHMSKSQFHRKITALSGSAPGHLIRQYRLERGKNLLLGRPELSVAEVAYAVGFSDPNYFSHAFSSEFGKSPRVFRAEMS
jgi:signal transduction histidine kinase/AraC-like DNA-binding protein